MFLDLDRNHSIHTFQPWQSPKSFMQSCRELLLFHSTSSLPKDSMLQAYFYFQCSDELHSLIQTIQIIIARTHYAMSTKSDHLHLLSIPIVRRKFHAVRFFLKTDTLWNKFLHSYFHVFKYFLKLNQQFYVQQDDTIVGIHEVLISLWWR